MHINQKFEKTNDLKVAADTMSKTKLKMKSCR